MNPHDPAAARQDQMVMYLLGELSDSEAADFQRRLAADPALAREVERLRRTLELVPFGVATAPPPHLRSRILAATRPRIVRWSRPIWRPLAAAAAAALLLYTGLDDLRVRRELALKTQVTEMLQQPNVVVAFPMKGASGARRAFGSILLDLDAKKAAIAIHRLPPPPHGKVYRLWAEVEARPIYCGRLGVNARGAVLSQLPIPVESYTAPVTRLFITLEPEDAPLKPSGPPLVEGT